MPTILDWVAVDAPEGFVDGHSYATDLRGEDASFVPEEVMLEGCRTQRTGGVFEAPDPDAASPGCGGYAEDMDTNWGLRTAQDKYVEYPDGSTQLFDLVQDLYEMTNLAGNSAHASVLPELRERLRDLRDG